MLPVGRDNQRFIEKDLFSLPKRYAMKFPVLLKIPVIPIKASAAFKRILGCHDAKYISDIYVRQPGAPVRLRFAGAAERSVFSCEVPSAARASSAAISKLGGALLVEGVVGALACERITELKLTAGRERVWGLATPCVLGSAGV